ncbi:MFS transporter [Fructilactobacillus fructivorans]|nr:MFS transporter [Fructilactobacillus fructivorans]
MDQEKKKYSPMMKFSLLAVSLVLASSLSVSAEVPQWQRAFPGHSYSSIELIATMPALAVIIFLLASSWIAKKIGPKRTVIFGLLVSGVAGVIPIFVTNYYVMLISRFAFGIGLGLLNGLAVSLIGTFFKGKEKNQLMGVRSGFEMLGNAISAYVAGALLVDFGWHSAFLIYTLAFPVAILFFFFVPNPPQEEHYQAERKNQYFPKVNTDVLFWTILLAVYQITYVGATVRIAEFIEGTGIGSTQQSAVVISIAPIFGLVGGIIFSVALMRLKKYLLPVGIIASGICQLWIGLSHSFFSAALGFFLVTFLDTMVVSYILNIATEISSKGTLNLTTSILLIGSNCGIFLAPIALGGIDSVFSSNKPALTFVVCGIILLAMGAVGLWDIKIFRRKIFK